MNNTEIVVIFPLFQLPPRVRHLRAFKLFRFEKRFCILKLCSRSIPKKT